MSPGADVLPDIIAGKRIVLPAIQENPTVVDFDNVAAEVKPDGARHEMDCVAGGGSATIGRSRHGVSDE